MTQLTQEREVEKQETILVAYHEADTSLWEDLAPHLRALSHLYRPGQWLFQQWPLPIMSGQQEDRKRFFATLEHLTLFIPCTSAVFVDSLWTDYQRDPQVWTEVYRHNPRLREALASVLIAPIALRPAATVSAIAETPLSAYPQGHERDTACVQIIQVLEEILRQRYGEPGDATLLMRARTVQK